MLNHDLNCVEIDDEYCGSCLITSLASSETKDWNSKQELHLQLILDQHLRYTSHVQWNRFLHGQLWGLDYCGRFKAFNSPLCINGAVMGFLNSDWIGKTFKQSRTGIFYWNPSYPSSSKLPYLLPSCSTTQCHKDYLERPQNLENDTVRKKLFWDTQKWKITRNKKKKENWTGKLERNSPMMSFAL